MGNRDKDDKPAEDEIKQYRLLGDVPVLEGERGDELDFGHHARVLANAALQAERTITIGIFGDWGSGKTSLMRLMKEKIDGEKEKEADKAVTVWFNAWRYEKEEHLIVPLIATIERELAKHMEGHQGLAAGIKERADKIGKSLRAFLGGFAIKGEVKVPFFSKLGVEYSFKDALTRYDDLIKQAEDAKSSSGLYFDAFEKLEKLEDPKVGKKEDRLRIVVFIDDLDRCLSGNAVELLEQIKLVLNLPGFSYALGLYETGINEAIKEKFPHHSENYLDKIVQVRQFVPQRETAQMTGFVEALLKEAEVDFADEEQKKSAIPLIAEIGKHNPRSIIQHLNRMLATLNIDWLKAGKNPEYDFSALVIDQAAREPKFFRRAVDVDLGYEEKQDVGQFLGKALEDHKGTHEEFTAFMDERVKTLPPNFKLLWLERAIKALNENEHLFNLFNTRIGRRWLDEPEYRRKVSEARERASGEERKERPEEREDALNLERPIHELLGGLVKIPAGPFTMGSDKGDEDERPPHPVNIKEGFEIGATPVTQEQYEAVMGENPSSFKGARNPVENVSWRDAMRFCEKLSNVTGRTFTLPSEAQWEYACRAGSVTEFCFDDSKEKLDEYAWHHGNAGRETHPVAEKKKNVWGLYDMHGNVWEWCLDHWHDNYERAPNDGSPWASERPEDGGAGRVIRGGAWCDGARRCRWASRNWCGPGDRADDVGFRVLAAPAVGRKTEAEKTGSEARAEPR